MALKRKNKVEAGFVMVSMTDIIFLLLLFFVIASTLSSPNDIKIDLPQSKAKTSTPVITKVFIDSKSNYFVAHGNEKPTPITADLLESYIVKLVAQDSMTHIALYADQNIPYRNVVRVLDIANQHKIKIVIATKPFEEK